MAPGWAPCNDSRQMGEECLDGVSGVGAWDGTRGSKEPDIGDYEINEGVQPGEQGVEWTKELGVGPDNGHCPKCHLLIER